MLMEYLLEKFTAEKYPNINTENCIYCSNKVPHKCNKCQQICPKNAIELRKKDIFLDKDICNRCGVCKVICPSQAINIDSGEENILRTIRDKPSIIIGCSSKETLATLKVNCLNAFHPEIIAAILILYEKQKIYFNISRCKDCDLIKDNETIFLSSISKAVDFLKLISIKPNYEIVISESELKNLPKTTMSRRDLFSLIKNESSNVTIQAVDTAIRKTENHIDARKVLIDALKHKGYLTKSINIENVPFFGTWKIKDNCNGCKICEKSCIQNAWKFDKTKEKLKIYHNSSKCSKCNICVDLCPQNSIEEGSILIGDIKSNRLVNEIDLVTCTVCNKEFVSFNEEKKCASCEKKEKLRNKISSIKI